jgi:hypothetical protein
VSTKRLKWLTRVVSDKTVNTTNEARVIFLALGENDACGLCFAALLSKSDEADEKEERLALLRSSAELGCALSQVKMAEKTTGEVEFRFATLAASQRERDGFYSLGYCFRYGLGCEQSEKKEKENHLIAAVCQLHDDTIRVVLCRTRWLSLLGRSECQSRSSSQIHLFSQH